MIAVKIKTERIQFNFLLFNIFRTVNLYFILPQWRANISFNFQVCWRFMEASMDSIKKVNKYLSTMAVPEWVDYESCVLPHSKSYLPNLRRGDPFRVTSCFIQSCRIRCKQCRHQSKVESTIELAVFAYLQNDPSYSFDWCLSCLGLRPCTNFLS